MFFPSLAKNNNKKEKARKGGEKEEIIHLWRCAV